MGILDSITSLFRKESSIEKARRLGIKYLDLYDTSGKNIIRNYGIGSRKILVLDVDSGSPVVIPIEEYNRYKKEKERERRINILLGGGK